MDPKVIKGRLAEIDNIKNDHNFFKPFSDDFYQSDKVVEIERLLTEILGDERIKMKLVASVCAIENCTYEVQEELMHNTPTDLARIFISGTSNELEMLFPPVPNFIFTRDIGIVIKDHILLNKPAKQARTREALLMKYIFFNHPLFKST